MIGKRYKISFLLFFATNLFLLFASQNSFATDYELLIIGPEKYETQLQDLQTLHDGDGMHTCYVFTEDIEFYYGHTGQPPAAGNPPFAGYKDGLDAKGKTNIKGYNYTLAKKIIAFLRHVNTQTPYGLSLLQRADTSSDLKAKFTNLILFGNSSEVPPSYYAFFQTEYDGGDVYNAWVPTDFFYASSDYDWVPELAVGRLPIKDVDDDPEISGMVVDVQQFNANGSKSITGDYYVYNGNSTGIDQDHHTFTDANANAGNGWIPGELVYATLKITSDPGDDPDATGKTYTIVSNTATTLYFSSNVYMISDGVDVGCGYGVSDLRSQIVVNVDFGDDDWGLNEYQGHTLTITVDPIRETTVKYLIDYNFAKDPADPIGTFILRNVTAWGDNVIPGNTYEVKSPFNEATNIVTKIENWYAAATAVGAWNDWFEKVAVAGGPSFGTSFYWDEFIPDSYINNGNFEGNEVTKLYHTDDNFTKAAVSPYLTDTNGSLIFHGGHGSGDSISLDGADITSDDILTYFSTDDKLPILASCSCDNGAFDLELYSKWFPTSLGEATVLSFNSANGRGGGGIAFVGASRSAYAGLSPYFVKGILTQDRFYYIDDMFNYFTKYFQLAPSYIGDAFVRAIKGTPSTAEESFIARNDMSYWLNQKTVFEYTLLGDPALPIPYPQVTPIERETTAPTLSVDENTIRTRIPIYESHDIPVDEIPTAAGTTNTTINITTTDGASTKVKWIDARRDLTLDKVAGGATYSFITNSDSPSYYLVRVARTSDIPSDGKETWIYVQAVNEFTKTNDILIVDDDYGYPFYLSTYEKGYEDWYQKSLSSPLVGKTYDVWHVDFDDLTNNIPGFNENDQGDVVMHGEITSDLLGQYTTVIYETGGDTANYYRGLGDTLTSPDQEYLKTYLGNNGKQLLLSGQDIMWDIGLPSLCTDYLSLSAFLGTIGYGGLYNIEGFAGDPISHDLHNINIAGGDGAQNQYIFNDVEPNALGSRAFEYLFSGGNEPPGVGTPPYIGTAATYSYVSPKGPVVFLPFGFESIDKQADRDEVMDRILDWLASPTPTGETGAFSATAGDEQITLTWNLPATSVGVLILRKDSGGHPTGTPIDGTSYDVGNTIGDGTVIYRGAGSSHIDTGLTNDNTYYYSAFFYNSGPSYGLRVNASATPSSGGGGELGTPYDLNAFAGKNSVALQWVDNSDGESGFLVERKEVGGNYELIGSAASGLGRYGWVGYGDYSVEADITYYYRVRAYGGSSYSGYSNEASATPYGWGPESISLESGGGSGCFIATAAYGTPMAEEVRTLCKFRDQYLLKCPAGKEFVKFYYKTSPPIADFIRNKPMLKATVRIGLKPLVWFSKAVTNKD